MARREPRFVAWELSRDHARSFGANPLKADLWTSDPETVASWLESRGTRVPFLPGIVAGLDLVGVRRCLQPDLSVVPHIYYGASGRSLSLFLVPRSLHQGESRLYVVQGNIVRLFRVGGMTVGIVSDRREDVAAFERALKTSRARIPTEPKAMVVTIPTRMIDPGSIRLLS